MKTIEAEGREFAYLCTLYGSGGNSISLRFTLDKRVKPGTILPLGRKALYQGEGRLKIPKKHARDKTAPHSHYIQAKFVRLDEEPEDVENLELLSKKETIEIEIYSLHSQFENSKKSAAMWALGEILTPLLRAGYTVRAHNNQEDLEVKLIF